MCFVFRKWVYKVCANTTSLTPPLCIEVLVSSDQESEKSCICVLGIYILSLSMIPQLDFWDFPTVFLFCFSFYYICLFVYLMVFNATFNHISVISWLSWRTPEFEEKIQSTYHKNCNKWIKHSLHRWNKAPSCSQW